MIANRRVNGFYYTTTILLFSRPFHAFSPLLHEKSSYCANVHVPFMYSKPSFATGDRRTTQNPISLQLQTNSKQLG